MLRWLRRTLLCNIAVVALFLLCVSLEHHCTGGKTEASRDGNPPWTGGAGEGAPSPSSQEGPCPQEK